MNIGKDLKCVGMWKGKRSLMSSNVFKQVPSMFNVPVTSKE